MTSPSRSSWESRIAFALGEPFPDQHETRVNDQEQAQLEGFVEALRSVPVPVFGVPTAPAGPRTNVRWRTIAATACLLLAIGLGVAIQAKRSSNNMPPPASQVPPGAPPSMSLAAAMNLVPKAENGIAMNIRHLRSRGSVPPGVRPGGRKPEGATTEGHANSDINNVSQSTGFAVRLPKAIPPKYELKGARAIRVRIGNADAPAAWLSYDGPRGAFGVLELEAFVNLEEYFTVNDGKFPCSIRYDDSHIVLVAAPTASDHVRDELAALMFPNMN